MIVLGIDRGISNLTLKLELTDKSSILKVDLSTGSGPSILTSLTLVARHSQDLIN